MAYYWIKTTHLSTVAFNLLFFALRFYWMIYHPHKVRRRWARTLSMGNDTLLLATGGWMAVAIWHPPFHPTWLSVKLLVILAYILLGSIALTWGNTKRSKAISGVLAMICSYYIVTLALSRSPFLWFG